MSVTEQCHLLDVPPYCLAKVMSTGHAFEQAAAAWYMPGPGVYSASNKMRARNRKKKLFWAAESGWHIRLTTSMPFVN
jgi:hypothetical protein